MQREVIVTGKTIEEALYQGFEELGAEMEQCDYEVLTHPKKSIFGKLKEPAKLRVWIMEDEEEAPVIEKSAPEVKEAPKAERPQKPAVKKEEPKPAPKKEQPKKEAPKKTAPKAEAPKADAPKEAEEQAPKAPKVLPEGWQKAKEEAAVSYLTQVVTAIGYEDLKVETAWEEEKLTITLDCENIGTLIGRHGETLDGLQYLTSLVANRMEGEYIRVFLNCANYREKREASLQQLAKRMAAKVKRTGRSQFLEPMNPYERRIIHFTISEMEGISSKSKGEEPYRRVVIFSNRKPNDHGYKGGGNKNRGGYKPRPQRRVEPTMEEILKAERSEEEKKGALYSKIEL